MRTTNLRIEIAGLPVNDYQITDNKLEFRTLDSKGRPFSDQRSTWRRLSASELVLHFRLNTVVGQWFLEKTAVWDSQAAQRAFPRWPKTRLESSLLYQNPLKTIYIASVVQQKEVGMVRKTS